ncbi:MAG: CAP domain-containing protein [Clostridia bacterium]|nr:CAP domain-containing protein [Clostridia bacterium]
MRFKQALSAILILILIAASAAHASAWLDGYAQNVISQTNMERAKGGLPALRVDAELMSAARIRAEEISRRFSHTRPNGLTGSSVTAAARNENIARGHGSPDRVMAAWLTSDSHRRNLLARGYGSIGVACLEANGVTYWVQLFGL